MLRGFEWPDKLLAEPMSTLSNNSGLRDNHTRGSVADFLAAKIASIAAEARGNPPLTSQIPRALNREILCEEQGT